MVEYGERDSSSGVLQRSASSCCSVAYDKLSLSSFSFLARICELLVLVQFNATTEICLLATSHDTRAQEDIFNTWDLKNNNNNPLLRGENGVLVLVRPKIDRWFKLLAAPIRWF